MTLGIPLYYVFLREKPTLYVLLSSALCITGVMAVIQPEFIFNTGVARQPQSCDTHGYLNAISNSTTEGMTSSSGWEGNGSSLFLEILKYALAVVSGMTFSVDVVILKKNPYLVDHVAAVLFWTSLFSTLLSIIAMLLLETPSFPTGQWDILNIILHCLCFAVMWAPYMYAVKHVSANACNVIYSMNVVLMLITQYTILSCIMPGHRNWIEFLGVILVLTGSMLNSLVEICRQH